MIILKTMHPWRLAMITGLLIVLAVWLATLIASPVGAGHKPRHNPGDDGGGTMYRVLITGDVATTSNATGDQSSFTTPGDDSGTKLAPDKDQPVKTFLDLFGTADYTHPSFGVCGNSVSQTLDNLEWDFKRIEIGKFHGEDALSATFRLPHGVYEEDGCGFDRYTLLVGFLLDEIDGPTVYDSNGGTLAVISFTHWAEKDDPSNKGNKSFSHYEEFGVFTGDLNVTVTITPVP